MLRLNQSIKKYGKQYNVSVSTPAIIGYKTKEQLQTRGGIMTLIGKHIKGVTVNEDKYGRWLVHSFFQDSQKIAIINAYMPCENTNIQSYWRLLRQNYIMEDQNMQINTNDVMRHTWKDLENLIYKLKFTESNIIIAMDANIDVNKPSGIWMEIKDS